jgi:hypothetical protein
VCAILRTSFQLVLDRDPLDFIERDLIAGTVIELGCARAFVGGHGLGVFQRAAGFQVGRDAGGPERELAKRFRLAVISTPLPDRMRALLDRLDEPNPDSLINRERPSPSPNSR